MDLYRLLPFILRLRSDVIVPNAGDESVLEKIVYALEQEADVTFGEVENLADLKDADACPLEYLPLLAKLLGLNYEASWSEEKKRLWVKAADLIWHIKGGRRSWTSILTAHGHQGYFPWELWKSTIYEEFNYSRVPDYNYGFLAARVDVCTSATDPNPNYGIYVDEMVEDVRPAHVLLRRNGEFVSEEDVSVSPPADTEYGAVGAVIDEDCDEFEDPGIYLPGDTCGATGLEIFAFCSNGTCELSCQTSCTSSCETGCIYGSCELTCQTFCTLNCQEFCMYACTTGCTGICETDCTVSCTVGCQMTCQATSCTVICEAACEAGCEPLIEMLSPP